MKNKLFKLLVTTKDYLTILYCFDRFDWKSYKTEVKQIIKEK